MVDDPAPTLGPASDPSASGPKARKAIHFQEWWIRHKGELPAHRFASVGADEASVLPAARDAILGADAVLFAPSNPVVSVGAILDVPGVRDALRDTAGPGGRGCRRSSAVARCAAWPTRAWTRSASRPRPRAWGGTSARAPTGGLLDGWLVHAGDAADMPGVDVRAVPLLMTDVDATAAMARTALDVAGV